MIKYKVIEEVLNELLNLNRGQHKNFVTSFTLAHATSTLDMLLNIRASYLIIFLWYASIYIICMKLNAKVIAEQKNREPRH